MFTIMMLGKQFLGELQLCGRIFGAFMVLTFSLPFIPSISTLGCLETPTRVASFQFCSLLDRSPSPSGMLLVCLPINPRRIFSILDPFRICLTYCLFPLSLSLCSWERPHQAHHWCRHSVKCYRNRGYQCLYNLHYVPCGCQPNTRYQASFPRYDY